MSRAITIGGLLATFGIIGSIVAVAIGILMFFAGMMSDAGDGNKSMSNWGCALFAIGIAFGIGCIIELVL